MFEEHILPHLACIFESDSFTDIQVLGQMNVVVVAEFETFPFKIYKRYQCTKIAYIND